MPLSLTIGDPGSHSSEPITSGSSRTFVNNIGMAYIGSTVATHTLPGPVTHGGVTIVTHGATGRTYTNNGSQAVAQGATGSCGDSFTATHTTRTFIGG